MNQTAGLKQIDLISPSWPREFLLVSKEDLPPEVAEALIQARNIIQSLPGCLQDLAEAKRNFISLNHSIDRLIELAQEAAALFEEDQVGRDERQVEFVRHARTVAGLAGQKNYDRPQLSVKTRPLAQASVKTLQHLIPVKSAFAARLQEQEELIQEAIKETINFLSVTAQSYPQVSNLTDLPELLKEVTLLAEELGFKKTFVSSSEARLN